MLLKLNEPTNQIFLLTFVSRSSNLFNKIICLKTISL